MNLNNITRILFIVLIGYFLTTTSVFAETNEVSALGGLASANWLLISAVLVAGFALFIFYWLKSASLNISSKIIGLAVAMILVILAITLEGVRVLESVGQELSEIAESNVTLISSSINTMIIIAVLGLIFLIAVGSVIYRSIILSLTVTVDQAMAIALGDFSQKIEIVTNDEIGQLQESLKIMQNNMKNIVMEINVGAIKLSGAADQVAQGNADLSQRTQEQASSLEEISSSMEEMAGTVNQNSDNAEQADDIALEARIQADKGSVMIHDVVTAIREIGSYSAKISDITGVIDDIAFQTNLLALNAAIEAARAGDSGRSFSVVASEVRSLASRSAVAAKEIKILIQESEAKVQEGTKLVDESGGVLNDIVMAVKKVGDRVSEIASASKEQAQGITQVNTALLQMDAMTQGNAALVEEASATSEVVGAQAQHLIDIVESFSIDDFDVEDVKTVSVEEVNLISDDQKISKTAHSQSREHHKESDDEWKDF